MSNHLHLVLHIDLEKAASWTQREVCLRWNKLFKNKEPVATFLARGKESTEEPTEHARAEQIRQNLSSISWFMKCLSEPIARRANAEDEITGVFWDKRFKSQALLDEASLLACMSYVDLNPIRAGVSRSLNNSNFSSIKERIKEYKGSTVERKLMPFKDKVKDSEACKSINFSLADYLTMVDQTGRALRNGRRGYIPKSTMPILKSLDIDPDHWLSTIEYFGDSFFAFIGRPDKHEKYKEARNCSRLRGIVSCNKLFRWTV